MAGAPAAVAPLADGEDGEPLAEGDGVAEPRPIGEGAKQGGEAEVDQAKEPLELLLAGGRLKGGDGDDLLYGD